MWNINKSDLAYFFEILIYAKGKTVAFFNDIFWLNLHKKKFYLKFGAKKCENDAGQPPFSPICFLHRERDFEAGFREFWRLEHRLLKDEFQNQEPEK